MSDAVTRLAEVRAAIETSGHDVGRERFAGRDRFEIPEAEHSRRFRLPLDAIALDIPGVGRLQRFGRGLGGQAECSIRVLRRSRYRAGPHECR